MEGRERRSSTSSSPEVIVTTAGKSEAPAKTSPPGFPFTGVLTLSGGTVVIKMPSGMEKAIPASVITERNLANFIGREVTGTMQGPTVVDIKQPVELFTVRKSDGPIAKPKAKVSEQALNHSWDGHTLRGIYRLKAITTKYVGSSVAIFRPTDMTWTEFKEKLMAIDGKELKWTARSSSQFESVYNGMKIIGVQIGDDIEVETIFPHNDNVSKEVIEDCLYEHERLPFRSFGGFRKYYLDHPRR
jgi:hypothetical protein